MTKRKAFNSLKQRIVDNDQKLHVQRKKNLEQKGPPPPKAGEKPKWAKQSAAFREMLRAAKKGIVAPPLAEEDDDRVECLFCKRKFNDVAIKKHQPICEKKHKESLIKVKSKTSKK